MELEQEIRNEIIPTAEEIASIQKRADTLKGIVDDYVASHGLDIELRFVGSFAKGTFLSDPDLDLFLLFPEDVPRVELERIGLRAGEDILGGVKMYSEHPYTRGEFEGLEVDLVPSYNLKSTENLQTAVDRTPFHTKYICSHLTDSQKDDVRLMKKFMKGIGAYGAEPNVRGFSGYLCELLIVIYGDFRSALEAISKWKSGTVIKVEEKGPKIESALVVYDPVDSKRNVASAVHLDTMCLAISAAKDYLECPDRRFFFPNKRTPLTAEKLKETVHTHGSDIISAVFARPEGIADNLEAQLWRTEYGISKKLEDEGFKPLRAVHRMTDDSMEVAIEIESAELPRCHIHAGPPVWVDSASNFLKKWENNENGAPFIKDGRWYVLAERTNRNAVELIKSQLENCMLGKTVDTNSAIIYDTVGSLENMDKGLLTSLLEPIKKWKV